MLKFTVILLLEVLLCEYLWAADNLEKKCKYGDPFPGVFCGRGPNRQDCPTGYSCKIHPTDGYAVCCADDICQLPVKPGPCRGYFPRWYYNTEANECQQFIYGGCQGNENNFVSKEECQKSCDVCKLKPDVGPCDGVFTKWFYNTKTKKCEKFSYGGCGGNGNRFNTRKQCIAKCDICLLPKVVGPCEAAIRRWFYNAKSGQCELFIYGGCEGNANNFETKEECMRRCDKCPPVDCKDVYCPYGFQMKKGCVNKKCRCYCPCYEKEECKMKKCKKTKLIPKKCPPGQICEVQQVQCVRPPCPPIGVCTEKKCDYGVPLPGVFCGRGPNRQDCPEGFECKIEAGDRYAVCCNTNICFLKPDSGCGTKKLKRWYYKQGSGCLPFIYSGEGGNKNNFKSKNACLRYCRKYN